MGSIKKFFSSLLSDSTEVSHKRLIALLSFIVLVYMVIMNRYGYQFDKTLISVFEVLCGGASTLSVVDKFSNKKKVL